MAAVIGIKVACPSVSNNFCCVWGCKSKCSRKSGVWMHTFPKDSQVKKEWEVRLKLGKKGEKSCYRLYHIYIFFSSCNLSSDKMFVLGQNNDIIVVVCD